MPKGGRRFTTFTWIASSTELSRPHASTSGVKIRSAAREVPNWRRGERMLQRSDQAGILAAESTSREFLAGTLDALIAQVVVTDHEGTILFSNEAWSDHVRRHGDALSGDGAGASYAAVCEAMAAPCLSGSLIRDALAGAIRTGRGELRTEYRCMLAGEERWFQLRMATFVLAEDTRRVFVHEDITDLKSAEDQLREAARQLLRVQDDERRRIARDLHDGPAQQMFALGLELARVRGELGADHPHHAALAECDQLSRDALRQLRTLSHLLHPPQLDHGGLSAALRSLVDGLAARSGMTVTLECELRERLPTEVEHALYRVAQEALTNVQRHARSGTALVRVTRTQTAIALSVRDFGRGFGGAGGVGQEGVGVSSMRERILELGGVMHITSGADGTELVALVPVGLPRRRP